MAHPKTDAKTDKKDAGALFDFDDLQALRDEYEERIARIERERDATIDVLKKEAENRLVTQKRDYEQRLQNEATSRQELIHELTFELAAAREDGERRAQEADKRRMVVEGQLQSAAGEISRIESDVERLKETLMKSAWPSPTPVPVPQPTQTGLPKPVAVTVAPLPVPPAPVSQPPSAAVAAYAPLKKKKIRLR